MVVSVKFAGAFNDYVTLATTNRAQKSEADFSSDFQAFIARAFDVQWDAKREKPLHMAHLDRRGRLDVLFGEVVFEFKTDLTTRYSDHLTQLENYLIELSKTQPHVGILTDGLKFEVHILHDGRLTQTDHFDLSTLDAEIAFVRLHTYIFTKTQIIPTAADMVLRFGGNSPMFSIAAHGLATLLEKVQTFPALAVWREQWSKLLSQVYGSRVDDDDLFIRHTYLCQFARLLAYAALRQTTPKQLDIEAVLTGAAFYGANVSNIGEHDFFAWVLLPEIKEAALTLFRRLAEGLIIYDLSRIDQDLLKQLYQNLVDPATRHDLGEYYTPDWLAELTLRDIGYQHPQSLLDPACGSGAFLFSAIKQLAAQGMAGWQLVNFVINNIAGMDVHPLAVIIARINVLLALVDHLRMPRPAGESGLIAIPVYMANALSAPELEPRYQNTLVIGVDERKNEAFFVPVMTAAQPDIFTALVDNMTEFASRAADPAQEMKQLMYRESFKLLVTQQTAVMTTGSGMIDDMSVPYWLRNLTLLTKLIQEKRDTIWGYILKNLSRPVMLAERRFDVIVGNPPWLSYRFIGSGTYQTEVKRLSQHYGLITSGATNQFSNMDLSTLFFCHARARYLKPGGTLAFVMPRAVITGAKQHRPFQAQGFSRVLDLLGVQPLFNVPTCVLVLQSQPPISSSPLPVVSGRDEAQSQEALGEATPVPAKIYSGKLPAHEMSLVDALPHLTERASTITFVDSDVRSMYYYLLMKRGATLIPRNLCFVKPEDSPNSPAVITDPDADREAKKPYKGISLRGVVDDDYMYATLLSKHLVPFGYEKLHMVALPARLENGKLKLLEREEDFAMRGHFKSHDWFAAADAKWASLKKTTTRETLAEYLNYQNKLLGQQPVSQIIVMYNASGTHLSSCVFNNYEQRIQVYGRYTSGFITDAGVYYSTFNNLEEAHFLCAILNAPCVDKAIKTYQTRGIYKGERDITRTPFEACAIPEFDAQNGDHLKLAELSQQAHAAIEAFKAEGNLTGSVYKIREKARVAAATLLQEIDAIAKRLLDLEN